jgi:hypothetical protein
MKFATTRPYANPEAAARKLIQIANSIEAVQDGRIFIELINNPMPFEHKATPGGIQRRAGLRDREGLAGVGPVRHFRPVHPGRCGAIRLKWDNPCLSH